MKGVFFAALRLIPHHNAYCVPCNWAQVFPKHDMNTGMSWAWGLPHLRDKGTERRTVSLQEKGSRILQL